MELPDYSIFETKGSNLLGNLESWHLIYETERNIIKCKAINNKLIKKEYSDVYQYYACIYALNDALKKRILDYCSSIHAKPYYVSIEDIKDMLNYRYLNDDNETRYFLNGQNIVSRRTIMEEAVYKLERKLKWKEE